VKHRPEQVIAAAAAVVVVIVVVVKIASGSMTDPKETY
jgi:hypothetical protein